MTDQLIRKVNTFTTKLLKLIDKDMNQLSVSSAGIQDSKKVTETLHKLITLVFQLKKLNKHLNTNQDANLVEDMRILENFIKKHQLENETKTTLKINDNPAPAN